MTEREQFAAALDETVCRYCGVPEADEAARLCDECRNERDIIIRRAKAIDDYESACDFTEKQRREDDRP